MRGRRKTREVKIGQVAIGGMSPIALQSMTNTKTEDIEATVAQILALESAGCDIVRSTVPTMEEAEEFSNIKNSSHITLVRDMLF